MKRKYTIFLVCIVAAATGTSCEKFFDRVPEDKFAASAFFASEEDLAIYANGLIDAGLPSAASVALGEDLYTDLCATRESKTFYEPNFYNPGIATGWSSSNWNFLRQVAYMIENMHNAKGNVSEEKYNHYEGVARFWRAYATFSKVKMFGDCYYIDRVVSPADSALLYGPRQSREYVVHKLLEDLEFACANCLATGPGVMTDGRIYVNRYVALAMASRICLYEGTYRKYHAANPSTGKPWDSGYESAEDLLQLAFDYSKELVENSPFTLVPDYRSLFTSKVLPKDEVIWGRSFSEELGVMHDVTYKYCSTTSSKLYSPTKDYVRMFLKKDGTPARANISMTNEFTGRDGRLSACVLGPGQKMTDPAGKMVDFAPNFTWTRSGYVFIKWVMPEYAAITSSNQTSLNSIPVLRYAEALLNYAEAAAELGRMDNDLWDKTIGRLRTRAGVKNIYPGSSAYVADTELRDYYKRGLAHPVELSDIMLEIRRERVTELMLEQDSRYDDLKRWNVADLIERRYNGKAWRGIYVTPEDAANGWTFNGKKFTVSTSKSTSATNYKITSETSQGFTLSEGTYGYLLYHYDVSWEEKMYLNPIPTTAINVNPALGQNDGWQWI